MLPSNELATLTVTDIVVIWGGTNDVNKNETRKGLKCLNKFVNLRSNTNVMILTIPHRYQLIHV